MHNSSIILPICQPSIITYLYHANYLSVAEIESDSRHYLINYFLQLYSVKDSVPGVTMVDFYCCDGKRPRYPFISKATLPTKTLRAFGDHFLDYVCGIIDSGSYVEATLDEFYIKEKVAYQEFHYPHRNLIYGYSRDDQIFHVQGFTKKLDFRSFTITFDEFRKAFSDELGHAFGDNMWLTVVSSTKIQDTDAIYFSPALIRTYLLDFIESRCSFPNYKPVESIFGAATYTVAIDKVQQDNGRDIDIRAWCIFHEHKLKLLNLCRYLIDVENIPIDKQTVDGLTILENSFLRLKKHMVRAKFARINVQRPLLTSNLAKMTEQENDLIENIIKALS